MTDDKPQPAPPPKKPQPEPDRKPRDIIPVAKLELRSDLTLAWPGYPAGARVITADEQVSISYHTAMSMYVVERKPRLGSDEKPVRKLIPREWAAMEPA